MIEQYTYLRDERSGLFFLAGADKYSRSARRKLTIHAAVGTLTQENRDFIEASAAADDMINHVAFQYHTTEELYASDSLEKFARKFQHDEVVADPTGAFVRISKLLELSRLIRETFGATVDRVLWRTHKSMLVVVPGAAHGSAAEFEGALRNMLIEHDDDDLRKIIKSLCVGPVEPGQKYTPIDSASHRAVPANKLGLLWAFARATGIAAILGVGSVATAAHAVQNIDLNKEQMMPGISALADLTTLGENSSGLRNHFQAVGGLRLYFREARAIEMSTFYPPEVGEDAFSKMIQRQIDFSDSLGKPLPAPVRLVSDS